MKRTCVPDATCRTCVKEDGVTAVDAADGHVRQGLKLDPWI